MKLVIIFGPPAVGKMTIGQELEKLSGLSLFHNHMSLELVNRFFDFGSPAFNRLDRKIRFTIFEEVSTSNLPGLIFTFVWALNELEDQQYINDVIDVFPKDTAVFFVELFADQTIRLKRNKTENRLLHKPSKRNFTVSENSLLNSDRNYRMNSLPGEFAGRAHLQIDTTAISSLLAAQQIFKFINPDL